MRSVKYQYWVVFLVSTLGVSVALAQVDEYIAGTHYLELPSQFEESTEDLDESSADTIEVIEFFAYNCKFCYRFESYITDWLKTKDEDVSFVREHVVFNNSMVPLARAFYVAEDLGILPKVHEPVFKAIHSHKLNLSRVDRLATLFDNAADVDPTEFKEKYDSSEIQDKIQTGTSKARVWRIATSGTPCLVVGGKYLVDVDMTPEEAHSGMFPIVDYLVNKIREERENSEDVSQNIDG